MKKVTIEKKQALIQRILAAKAQKSLTGGAHCIGHCVAGV